MKKWHRPLVWWLYSAVAVTGVCALVHVAVQQSLRQGANDPQIALAEDGAARLGAGDVPTAIVPQQKNPVAIKTSLAPWVAVYNAEGQPLVASGYLNGDIPKLPPGVFDTASWKSIVGHHLTTFYPKNENRFSWQFSPEASGPESYARQAVVLVQAPNGEFVASGRSLREVESRESLLTLEVFILWAFTLACLLIASFVADWVLKR